MSFRNLHQNVQIRLITTFTSRLISSAIYPFIAIYFSREFSPVLAGVFLAVTIFFVIAGNMIGGYLSDKFGRLVIMEKGLIFQTGFFLIMAFSNSSIFQSPLITLLAYNMVSFFSGFISPGMAAMVLDHSTEKERAFLYKINYWSINIAIALGAVIGGFLFEEYLFQLFLVQAGGAILTLILFRYLGDTSNEIKHESNVGNPFKGLLQNYKKTINNKMFYLFFLANVLLMFLEYQNTNYIAWYLSVNFQEKVINIFTLQHSINPIELIGYLKLEETILIILVTLLFKDHIKNKTRYASGIIFVLSYCFMVILPPLFYILVIIKFIQTTAEVLFIPNRQESLAQIIPSQQRGSYFAIYNLSFQVSRSLAGASLLLGEVVGNLGMGLIYLIVGFTSIKLFYAVEQSYKLTDA
ncbi:hypothetical protein CN378_05945 [Bacillus sp. AFS015802]|uniref:MFS transporter n=1 Tax=Bacillus sp. AFS015802 TaxID=2033486 RepID=UPI000BF5DD87|nr:MFS transporter [Bacillus sp. AFS015802]PFA68747.1 hypothetical protein CN378_05945 [Bacillus sp. AFS015802]